MQYQGIFIVTVDSAWSCRWPQPWRSGTPSLAGIFAGSWIASRRHFFSIGRDALLDCGANRLFVIPLEMRAALDLDPPFNAVLVGLGDSVEIWPEANYYIGLQLAAAGAPDNPDQKKMTLAGVRGGSKHSPDRQHAVLRRISHVPRPNLRTINRREH